MPFLEFVPVAVQVLIDWIIMMVGTIGTFFKKKEQDDWNTKTYKNGDKSYDCGNDCLRYAIL